MMSTKTRAYTALPELGKRTYLFTIEDFIYDAEKNIYTCPRGEILHRLGRRSPVRTSENASYRDCMKRVQRVVCDPEWENVCTAGPGKTSQLFIGTNGADDIAARGGDDHIKGKNGGDDLYGDTGRDFIEASVGDDTIRGNQQPDTILAGSGADTIYGDEGRDHLVGASGRDTFYAYGDGRRDHINCGGDFDRAYVDRDDIVGETCERVRLGKSYK